MTKALSTPKKRWHLRDGCPCWPDWPWLYCRCRSKHRYPRKKGKNRYMSGSRNEGWYYTAPVTVLAMAMGLLWSVAAMIVAGILSHDSLLVPGSIAGVAGVLFVFRERQIASRRERGRRVGTKKLSASG